MEETRRLAEFCARVHLEDVPPAVVLKARLCILDWVANIYGSQIGHRVFAQNQAFKHRLVDHAAGHLLIGAKGLQIRIDNSGPDQGFIDGVKIHHGAAGRRFAAERHQHKT